MSRVLLADIGGTYARFTLANGHLTGGTWSTEVGSRANAIDAMRDFLAIDHGDEPIAGALLAAAGPVEGGRCKLTNAAWVLDEEEIGRALSLPWVRIVNDLEATAGGLPDLTAAQSRQIGAGGSAIPGAPMAIIAPGTGLGMACVIVGPAGRSVVTSEGGHASLASMGSYYDRVVAILRQRYGRVSIERVLSGGGLVNLHQAIAELEGCESPRRTPSDVTAGAFDGSSPLCRAAVDAFCAFLGAVAGDVALTFGARGGVFIGGGIVPRFIDHLAHSAFREQFVAKGRMRAYLERVPTRVILHPTPAFAGLMNLARLANEQPRPRASR
ncbi:glucokinase [Reyranella sp.]|uniref:glucokinase n=1 Tax=Reyranella sp. TaxID=1929291 RepID=UPI003D0B659E